MLYSEQDLYQIMEKSGIDAASRQSVVRYVQDTSRKDAMPVAGRVPGHRMYEDGPFSQLEDEITSLYIDGGSPLMNWLPSRKITSRFERVSHLEWIAPEGYDGSHPYPDWLASLTIPDCGYGPSTSWSGFTYQQTGGQFSFTTGMMKPWEDGGSRYYEDSPIYQMRGPNRQDISDDKEWAVARVLLVMQQHLDYVLKHGQRANSNMEWDGLLEQIQPGYVQARVIGSGIPHWADPVYTNGAVLTTIMGLLQTIRYTVRRLRNRAGDRQWSIQMGDMVVLMPSVFWDIIAETVAAGGMYAYTNTPGFNGQMTFREFREELRSIKSGGLGFGTMDVDGDLIPILTDRNMGYNVTIDDTVDVPGYVGDVMVLTRRAGGMTLLEQQYVDWTQLDYPAINEEQFALQQGQVRAGWITESNKCFYYYAEMAGRVVVRMMPLQAAITNVMLALPNGMAANEGGMFWNPDFYAANGLRMGEGTPRLYGV